MSFQKNSINYINPMNFGIFNNNNKLVEKYYLNKLNISLETFDLTGFQLTINELLLQQGKISISNHIKNILLNKAILLYLSNYSQINIQYILKQIISLLLLKLKSNPNIRLRYLNAINNLNNNIYNNYAFFFIIEKNDIELFQVFLNSNLDIQIKDSKGCNALFYLMTFPYDKYYLIDRKPLCSLLLSHKIEINYTNINGISPMMEAINKGYNYILNMLIKFGGDVNIINPNDGNTALHYAIINENKDALFLLFSSGNCDLNIKNKKGETALDITKKIDVVNKKEIYELISKFISYGKSDDKNNNYIANNIKNNINDNDEVFMFLQKKGISSRLEIPFNLQKTSIFNSNEIELKKDNDFNNNQFFSFIKIENTPTLYLDISNEEHQNNLIYDGLNKENINLEKTLNQNEKQLINIIKENETLTNELNKLKDELNLKSNEINTLTEQKTQKENKLFLQFQLYKNILKEKDKSIQNVLLDLQNLENKLKKENKQEEKNIIKNEEKNGVEDLKYYEKKFFDDNYNEKEVINLLSIDLYDFYIYNQIIYESRIKEINKMINKLKSLLEDEATIKLYGSYETKTSLSFSEVDLLVISKSNKITFENNQYNNFNQRVKNKLKNSFLKNDIKIKYNNVKIAKKDSEIIYNLLIVESNNSNGNDHNYIKSVLLINKYINKYKDKFIPILLSLKQILYNGNVLKNYWKKNDKKVGGIDSYALNILLMNFLDDYNSSDISLGQIFIDFLIINSYLNKEKFYYKKIVYLNYDFPLEKIQEVKSLYETSQESLIILDPFDIKNNLTDGMFRIYLFEITFMVAYNAIKDNCDCSCHYDDNNKNKGKIHFILNKIFKTVQRFNIIRNNEDFNDNLGI